MYFNSERRTKPTTAFPPCPDELDDAVYQAYVAFVATNLHGWPRRTSSKVCQRAPARSEGSTFSTFSGSTSIPLTPALSLSPSTPTRSARSSLYPSAPSSPTTPTTPFPSSPPRTPPRASSLKWHRASPSPSSSLKHRISAPIPLQRPAPTPIQPRTVGVDEDPSEAAFEQRMTISEFEQRFSFAQLYCKAYDQLYDEPEEPLQPPPVADLWRRGSSSSASSALPSIVEDPEAAVPVTAGGDNRQSSRLVRRAQLSSR